MAAGCNLVIFTFSTDLNDYLRGKIIYSEALKENYSCGQIQWNSLLYQEKEVD